MTFTILRDAQGKPPRGGPLSVTVTKEPRDEYQHPCSCAEVYVVTPESINEMVERGLVLRGQASRRVAVCACLGAVVETPPSAPVEPFPDLLQKFKSAWRPSELHALSELIPSDDSFNRDLDRLLIAHAEHITELVPRPKQITPKLLRPLACLDIEGTSLDVTESRIVELAVVVLDIDGSRREWQSRFNPGIPIPADATAVHGITDADVANWPPFKDSAGRILRGLQGKDLCGYNLWGYDLGVLDCEMRRAGLRLDMTGISVIDVFGIYQNKDPRNLEAAVRKYCGREHSGAHGALADAVGTLDCLIGQLGMYDDLASMDLPALAQASLRGENAPADLCGKLTRDKEGFLVYNFGKVRGTRVKDDSGFAMWMRRNNFPASTIEVLDVELHKYELP